MIAGMCLNPNTHYLGPAARAKAIYTYSEARAAPGLDVLQACARDIHCCQLDVYTSSSAAVPARISFCDLVPAFSTFAAAVVAADGQIDSSQLS
jgi:hypothetical protein